MRKILILCLPLLVLASCCVHEDRPPFLARFQNMLYTDISVSVDGYGTKVIAPGETATFMIDRRDQVYHYEAETHGSTSNGEITGLVVEWSLTRDIVGDSYTTYLITAEDLFFLKMRNTGYHDLHPLYVNYGLPAETEDNITIPGNGLTYNVGYYKAFGRTRIQADWLDMPSDYTYWQNRVHFNFPWTENQSITLLNEFKKDASGKQIVEVSSETSSIKVDPRDGEPFGTDAGTARIAK